MKDAQPNPIRTRPVMTALVAAVCLTIAPAVQAGGADAAPSIRYMPLNAPSGMSQAVIVDRMPLVYTRQLFPFDTEGNLIGPNSTDAQIEQVLSNLEAVLKTAGSGLDRLIRLNVYALSNETADRVRQLLDQRLNNAVRPAITSVLTPLPHRGAVVAVDAVAGAAGSGATVALNRCGQVAGNDACADAAVLPAGDIAYLSGMPQPFELTVLPTTKAMTLLMNMLHDLELGPEHVVQVKVFINPITSAKEVLEEVKAFFPGPMAPPVVFVEWLASVPVEIELIAQLPPSGNRPAGGVQYYNPPQYRPSNTFSRSALMRADRQIYISGLYADKPSRGEPQAILLFDQLAEILEKTGSDMRHLVKATYYVTDHDAARWVDRTRPKIFDPLRPPAASKLTVHGVARFGRTMTVDMIAVEAR